MASPVPSLRSGRSPLACVFGDLVESRLGVCRPPPRPIRCLPIQSVPRCALLQSRRMSPATAAYLMLADPVTATLCVASMAADTRKHGLGCRLSKNSSTINEWRRNCCGSPSMPGLLSWWHPIGYYAHHPSWGPQQRTARACVSQSERHNPNFSTRHRQRIAQRLSQMPHQDSASGLGTSLKAGGCCGRPFVKASSGGVAHVWIWVRNSVMRAWAAVAAQPSSGMTAASPDR